MYNWVICSYLGHSDSVDVDGICPRLCRPHSEKTKQALRANNLKIPVPFYADYFDENALDICEQLQYAVPGSCTLAGKGIGIHEYK